MKTKISRSAGFTLVEIMIVIAIIGLLAGIAVPNLLRSRESAQLNNIINNLRIIEEAKERWALENNRSTGDPVGAADINSYIRGGFGSLDWYGWTPTIDTIGQLASATGTAKAGKTIASADGITAP